MYWATVLFLECQITSLGDRSFVQDIQTTFVRIRPW